MAHWKLWMMRNGYRECELVGIAKLTTAFLDRLTHRCEIVETCNESWRFKNRAQRQAGQRWSAAAEVYEG